jgi:hypothetical protein
MACGGTALLFTPQRTNLHTFNSPFFSKGLLVVLRSVDFVLLSGGDINRLPSDNNIFEPCGFVGWYKGDTQTNRLGDLSANWAE